MGRSEGKVTLVGDVTIARIGQVRDELAASMREADVIVIDVERLATTDLSVVQLLEAARRKAEPCGIEISLGAPASGSLLDVLKRGGFLNGAPERSRFWVGEAAQ